MPLNIEIKARCSNPEKIHSLLKEWEAEFRGIDHQIDTYFKVESGKLKLREGNIENNLIRYNRTENSGTKRSEVVLHKPGKDGNLKIILAEVLGILTEVDKRRYIYFIKNVKFHVDEVVGLGSFLEIEAIDQDGNLDESKLQEQCLFYMHQLGVNQSDLVAGSYSDMIITKQKQD